MSTRSTKPVKLVVDEAAAASAARSLLGDEGPLIEVLRGQLLDDEIAELLTAAVADVVVTYVALANEVSG